MKKKILIPIVIALVIIVAGGSAFLYTRMTATKDEEEASHVTANDAGKQAEAPPKKPLNDKEIAKSDSAEDEAENPEEGKEEVDRSKMKDTKADEREKQSNQALENLDKERKETLKFLGEYDDEARKKKDRSSAIERWLEKKPN